MRVLIAKPGEEAQVVELSPGIASIQEVVGGWVERWAVDGNAHFMCNEDGKRLDLDFNRFVVLSDGSVWDVHGPIVIAGANDEGMFDSLSDADIDHWKPRLDTALADTFHCVSRATEPSECTIRPIPLCDWIVENGGRLPHYSCVQCIYNTSRLSYAAAK